jgi:hypothetical protein
VLAGLTRNRLSGFGLPARPKGTTVLWLAGAVICAVIGRHDLDLSNAAYGGLKAFWLRGLLLVTGGAIA